MKKRERDEAIRLWGAGQSVKDISTAVNVTPATVYKWLRDIGVEFTPIHRWKRTGYVPRTGVNELLSRLEDNRDAALALERYRDKWIAEALELGVPPERIDEVCGWSLGTTQFLLDFGDYDQKMALVKQALGLND